MSSSLIGSCQEVMADLLRPRLLHHTQICSYQVQASIGAGWWHHLLRLVFTSPCAAASSGDPDKPFPWQVHYPLPFQVLSWGIPAAYPVSYHCFSPTFFLFTCHKAKVESHLLQQRGMISGSRNYNIWILSSSLSVSTKLSGALTQFYCSYCFSPS